MKICLDAGHYGKQNRSPANTAYYESEAMWKLTNLQKKYLEAYGCEVILTRTDPDKDKPVYDRGTAARGCDLFISNHSNATAGADDKTDYPIVFVPLNGKGNTLGEKLAACVQQTMETAQKGRIATKAGSGGSDYYGVIRGAVAAGALGILIEHSFHTHTKMTNWLLSDANLDRLAKAEADVIAGQYGLKLVSSPAPEASAVSDRETKEEKDMTKEELMTTAGTGDKPSDWHKKATEYCKRKGIFNGDGAGNYGWQAPISREAAAQIAYNILEAAGLLDKLPDVKK